jgi:hypothetical protein
MKKFIVALMVIFLSACTLGAATTPKEIVSEFLDKYKNQNEDIISQLDETIDNQINDEDQKSRYKTLMTNQYKNMEYEIKDEIIEDDNAVVEVEVTVYDYASALKNANTYLNEHLDEFKADVKDAVEDAKDAVEDAVDNDNEVSTDTDTSSDSDYDEDKFMDYKISEMEKVKDTTKYTIEFTLTKVNDEWQLDALSNSDIEKLHGIYIS